MTTELDAYIPPSGQELEQTWQLASKLARTEFVPRDLRGKPEAVLACMLTGRELGIGPMQALRDIYVVNGRPALSATLMVTRVRAHGHRFRTITSSEQQATVQVHRHSEDDPELPVTWTLEDAKRADLLGKDIWRKYPKAMLWARAASAACRRDCPEALGGAVYTPEEIESSNGETTTTWGRPEQSDPPSRPTPPGRDQGGSDPTSPSGSARDLNPDGDPTSGTGVTGASSRTVPDQTSEAGERETATPVADGSSATSDLDPDRHDPASDSSSPASGRGSQPPGTATSETSGVGSRHAPAGSREGDPPAGSPTPDLLSPSGPARAQKAKAAERGDTNMGPAGQGEDGGSAGPAYPVEEWAINQDPPVDLRVAKVALRKQFKEDFGWLKDWRDLQELQGEQAVNAIKALEAIYLDPREGKA
jgi:hypothetical protein